MDEILIQGGRILDPAADRDEQGDLLIREGRIAAPAEQPGPGARVIDAQGLWVVPGLIDMHVHLREPGEEYKEDIASGCRAAAAGGFTAVACMPNTRPVNDSEVTCRYILEKARQAACRVHPVAAISRGSQGEELCDFAELAAAGAVGVSDDGLPVRDARLMRRALEYAADHGLIVISHAEEPSLAQGVMNEGEVSTRLGLAGIPTAAEAIMVYREIALAEYLGLPVHIAHVSAAMSVDIIRAAKRRGVRVSAETAPHYFTLTHEAVDGYDTHAKMNPPLRGPQDREAIRTALADGTLDAIATDHAPHSALEKEVEFDLAANGIIGLETSLPLSLDLVRQGLLSPLELIRRMSTAPARILGVEGGSLAPGAAADVTLIDPEASYALQAGDLRSRSANSPFLDRPLRGRAVLTLCGGRVTHGQLGL